ALQDQRQTKQTPHDLAVLLARGPPTQISRRMIRVRDDDRLTHDDPPAPESAQVSESHTAPGGNPPRESQPEAPGIIKQISAAAPMRSVGAECTKQRTGYKATNGPKMAGSRNRRCQSLCTSSRGTTRPARAFCRARIPSRSCRKRPGGSTP